MSDRALWLESNIEEIQKRTINYRELNCGKIIMLQGTDDVHINLVYRNENSAVAVVKDLIDYKKLKTAKTVEQRISMVLDKVRSFNFYFSFEKSVTDIILNG